MVCRYRGVGIWLALWLMAIPALSSRSAIAAPPTGYFEKVSVERQGEIDAVFPLANQSPGRTALPRDWNPDYDATRQSFELYAPEMKTRGRAHRDGAALILFISPGDGPAGWSRFQQLCQREGCFFASPYQAGNNCPGPRRVQIVLDVLDQLRRTYEIDPDRTYLAGFSGGGRVAQQIVAALPEYFGGAMPICAAELPRPESWLRERAEGRLSFALVTGESDFNRGEVERWKGPLLNEVGLRARVWVAPKLGHDIPGDGTLATAFAWLEDGLGDRKKYAQRWPAARVDARQTPDRASQAGALLAEARARLKAPATLYSGLMQLQGISVRWPDLAEAEFAKDILIEYDARDQRPWESDDIAEQRKYLIAEARGLTAYATGELPQQYLALRPRMARAAMEIWEQIVDDGQNPQATAEGKRQIPVLEKLLEK